MESGVTIMRIVQFPGTWLGVGLSLLLSTGAYAQATATSVTQSIAVPKLHAGFATSSNGPASTLQTTNVGIQGFDADLGVLVGASASLQIDPGYYLGVFKRDHNRSTGSNIQLVWSLDPSWTGLATSTSACGTLCGRILVQGPSLDALKTDFDTVAIPGARATSQTFAQTAALQSLVRPTSAELPSPTVRVDTTINVGGNGGNDAKITVGPGLPPGALDPNDVPLPIPPQAALSGVLTMNYNYLTHSAASFAAGTQVAASRTLQFEAAGSQGFDIFALGDSHTAAMDFAGVTPTCISGACDQFTLEFTGANDSFAGTVMHGTLTSKGTAPGRATFAFTFADDGSVGVGQRSQTLTLTAVSSVTAVPEPHSAAMLLAGLGAIGWLSRRRRATQDQVARL